MSNLTKIVGLNILQSSQIIDLQAVRFLIRSRFCKNPAEISQSDRSYDL